MLYVCNLIFGPSSAGNFGDIVINWTRSHMTYPTRGMGSKRRKVKETFGKRIKCEFKFAYQIIVSRSSDCELISSLLAHVFSQCPTFAVVRFPSCKSVRASSFAFVRKLVIGMITGRSRPGSLRQVFVPKRRWMKEIHITNDFHSLFLSQCVFRFVLMS